MNNKITNYCNGNQCSRCGACCTPFLPFTKKELNKIKKYLRENPQIVEKVQNTPFNPNVLRCCFYVDGQCLIYKARPLICQLFKCNQSMKVVEENKNRIMAKADYNNDNRSSINDFRNLLFNDSRTLRLFLGMKGDNPYFVAKVFNIDLKN